MKKTKTGDSIHLTLGGIIEADMPERRTRVERRRVHVDLSEVGIKEDRRRGDRRGTIADRRGTIADRRVQSIPVENDRRKADRRGFERTEFPRVSVDPLRTLR
ncbi:MAG: hypothetical protein VXZ27_05940 [SAR324 cluster bacterium]|nr:hypothetical protein [SAR324 cluster bacterium]MEC8435344.1 hypothetical protein [SAR324 cluster bacterium]MEC8542520.1 hypothetical protein [SAR324 cluster bacterium]MEC8596354.1 hypothetical protein [SAR324 cluster bacterium]